MWFFEFSAVLFVVAAAWSSEFFASGARGGDALGARTSLSPVDQAMVAGLAMAAISAGCSVPALLVALDSALAEKEEPPGLECVAKSLMMGGAWEGAWQSAPSRFDPLRNALEPPWVNGAAAVPPLERTAASLRAGHVRRARESAARLGAKLVLPLGLCSLPAFIPLGVVPIVVSAGVAILRWSCGAGLRWLCGLEEPERDWMARATPKGPGGSDGTGWYGQFVGRNEETCGFGLGLRRGDPVDADLARLVEI